MRDTTWRLTGRLRRIHCVGPNPERVEIPAVLIRRAWLERWFNLWVTVERLQRDGRWEVVFHWPARKLNEN